MSEENNAEFLGKVSVAEGLNSLLDMVNVFKDEAPQVSNSILEFMKGEDKEKNLCVNFLDGEQYITLQRDEDVEFRVIIADTLELMELYLESTNKKGD